MENKQIEIKEKIEKIIKDIDDYLVFLEKQENVDLKYPINYLKGIKNQINNKLEKIISRTDTEISVEEELFFRINDSKGFIYIIDYLNKNQQFDKLQEVLGRNFYLKKSNLAGANLTNINLKDANLERANLDGANLEYADLRNSNLKGVNLSNIHPLVSIDSSHIYIEGADLSDANLEGMDLSFTKLEGTNLSGANLRNALFKYNNFIKDKSYLKIKNFILAKNWESIRLIIFISDKKNDKNWYEKNEWKDFERGSWQFNSVKYRYLSKEEINEIKTSYKQKNKL